MNEFESVRKSIGDLLLQVLNDISDEVPTRELFEEAVHIVQNAVNAYKHDFFSQHEVIRKFDPEFANYMKTTYGTIHIKDKKE